MKIAYILPSLANKGPIIVVKDIVAHLHSKVGINVFYFDPIEEVTMLCPTKRISFFEEINFNEFDIIHSHMLRPDAYIRLNRKKIKALCISTLHNYVEDDLAYQYNKFVSKTFTFVWKKILAKHDLLVALSLDMKSYYERLYGHKNISFIFNGRKIQYELLEGAIPEEEQIVQFKADSILIGAAALLTHRKGLDQLIKLLTYCKDYKLLIIGDGQVMQNLLSLSRELNVDDRCLFLGYRNNAFLYFKYFDIYAMPSRSEGFSLALIEASAFGLPTICSNLPVLKEIFNNDEVVFYELDNIKDLYNRMEHLIENKDYYAQRIRNKYELELTEEVMAEKYLSIYTSLLNDGI